jgi:hypothetical protein
MVLNFVVVARKMERRAMPISKKAPVKKPEVKKVEPTQE